MPRKRGKAKKNNLRVGIVFSALIALLIAFSLIGKLASIWEQGKYDDNYPLLLKVESKKGVQFLSIFPKGHTISLLNVSGDKDVSRSLAIPGEAELFANEPVKASDISSFFRATMGSNVKTDLTPIDKLRLYLFSKSVKVTDVKEGSVSASDETADRAIASLFSDSTLNLEGLRVEVVNATGAYGVGNFVARLLSNIGTNVVFVSTADKTQEESVIYYQRDKVYTVKRLERALGLKAVKSTKTSISDITVQIGRQSLGSLNP
ncbi:MAG: LytR C-terminal domain-containing protein [Candidatus Levybacteria bacterium]|nr:LytR C-terminal domain-containing protein [Candidatus Levybacteria bacterium]